MMVFGREDDYEWTFTGQRVQKGGLKIGDVENLV